MMTIQEIESACDASLPLDFSRHAMEAPELTLRATFYPFGFPAEVRTNSAEILALFGKMWEVYECGFRVKPIRISVHVVEGPSTECPPVPAFHTMQQTMVYVADADHYGVIHFGRNESQVRVSQATLQHTLYLRNFLEVTAWAHIRTQYMTPVHAGCVALDGRGVLLCGDAGAGKSTLSYACARAGWTYVTDDASHLMNDADDRLIRGTCHKVRFRPTAAELFPELQGQEVTPRMEGKPSIEMPTATFPEMVCALSAQVNFIVFLNRRTGGPPELVPYRKDVARYFMRQIHGTPESLPVHYQAIERLLTVPVFELRYSDLDWAIDRLRTLVREGC
jgi:hypothetical protein